MTQNSEIEWWIDSIRQLISRLERISADSAWAYRASGLRGSLLRCLDQLETQLSSPEQGQLTESQRANLQSLTGRAFEILTRAARDVAASRP
jgi:hypothetical protein